MFNFKISNHPNIPFIQRVMQDFKWDCDTSEKEGAIIKLEFYVKHYACNVSVNDTTNVLTIEDESKYIKELDKNIDLRAIKGRPFITLINGETQEIDQYDMVMTALRTEQMSLVDILKLFVASNDTVVYNGDGTCVINAKCNYM